MSHPRCYRWDDEVVLSDYSPASSLGWLDFDTAATERVTDLIRALQEPATLDVLGLGSVRDVFSNMLHPGTTYAHTKLRYFVFLPWIFQCLERERVPPAAFWLGYVSLTGDEQKAEAAGDIASKIGEALKLRTSSLRVDVPSHSDDRDGIELDPRRMRTRFAVAFGDQTLDEGGVARVGAVSVAFNSPFWPFVLATTSVGQEGLDFHLWCHAVVHWNLPSNPVDLEQREGRVHRYKCHAVRRNIAEKLGADLLEEEHLEGDLWQNLFERAASQRAPEDGEMVPYWVFHQGRAKIDRLVPVLPFSQESARLPLLRRSLAIYRLAFGQPRQEELVELLSERMSPDQLKGWLPRLRIDLSPRTVN